MAADNHSHTVRRLSTGTVFDISVLVAYITFMVTLAWSVVGKPTDSTEPVGWMFPVMMAVFLIFPAMLGFKIGKAFRSDEEKSND